MLTLSIPALERFRKNPGTLNPAERLAPGITLQTYEAANRPKQSAGFMLLHADSLTRLADWTAATPCPDVERWGELSSREHKATKEWDFCAGWKGAQEIARHWPEGRDKVKTIAATLPGDFVALPPVEWDATGDRLDVASFLAGDPEPWEIDADAPGRGRFVRLIVPTGAPWFVEARALQNRGAAIASVVDGLEAAGIRCEIEAFDSYSAGENVGQLVVAHRVKEAGAHLNLERLAASLAHPAIFRRIGFAALEALCNRSVGSLDLITMSCGYGTAAEVFSAFRPLFPADTIFLPRLSGDGYDTPESAREKVAEAFAEAGFNVQMPSACAPGSGK